MVSPPLSWVSFTTTQIGALTASQVKSLSTASFGGLHDTQIDALSAAQLGQLSTTNFNSIDQTGDPGSEQHPAGRHRHHPDGGHQLDRSG